ncbi:hypothetical protein [Nocardiopsis sp. NPDC006938]|uniref:hypothetical protein n=1 Tax=Nocardiopsis sp. NPDC006938 TaxID=3364337 RepID=UPI0036B14EDA
MHVRALVEIRTCYRSFLFPANDLIDIRVGPDRDQDPARGRDPHRVAGSGGERRWGVTRDALAQVAYPAGP